VLTPRERLTAPGVVIHLHRCRARACKDRRALRLGLRPSRRAFESAAPASTSAEPRVHLARLVPPHPSNIHKNHLATIQIP